MVSNHVIKGRMNIRWVYTFCVAMICGNLTAVEPASVTIAVPSTPYASGFKMGTSLNPAGHEISINSRSLLFDGQPWFPVVGEMHYSRVPEAEWREELLKMKAGGVDTVSTYVFWIHQEEIEGQWDWNGRRNLRRFVQTCQEVGLNVIVRCGPWDHGEVRNGGFPDWLIHKGWQLRSDDPRYLAQVKIFYDQIAAQLKGLLWKDGGPVVGIQLENEYSGPAEHLLTLKRMAQSAGLDVPLYTKTGWPSLSSPLPFGEIIPFYGVYAEGFWDRTIAPMPDDYRRGFYFSCLRDGTAMGADILGDRDVQDAPDVDRYPYLTCEIGAGMMTSYHRRILIYPEDAESVALVKLGSGCVSLGYYMYHGGENPDGNLTTLEESQATGYMNDLPVKSYDFQTALGQYGQIRPQYNLLRRIHLFLHEWGSELADMPATMPDKRPQGKNDVTTLRWSVRSNGTNGFVFVNNYQRLQTMPPKTDVQFKINLPSGSLTFPEQPATIPSDACFFWPFNLNLGKGVQLSWATAQPLTAIDDGKVRTVFFAETKDIPVQLAFKDSVTLQVLSGHAARSNGQIIVHGIRPGVSPAIKIKGDNATLQIVVLSDAESLELWKGTWHGCDRAFLSQAGLVLDGDNLQLTSENRADLNVGIYPAPPEVTFDGEKLRGNHDGIFKDFRPSVPTKTIFTIAVEKKQSAGPARKIPMGKITDGVAAEPEDADFKSAAVWQIKISGHIDPETDPLLRINYLGDVARLTLDGKLLDDNFYNGRPFEVGLRRYGPKILTGDLRLEILPLSKDSPILIAPEARPDFNGEQSIVLLDGVKIVPQYKAQLNTSAESLTEGHKSNFAEQY